MVIHLTCTLTHQVTSTGAFDFAGDFAVKLSGNASHTTWKNLASLSGKFLEKVSIFVVELSFWNVVTTVRHWAVSLPERNAAFLVFRSRD